MNRTFEKRWSDFTGRYGTRPCPLCKDQTLDFSSPKFGNVAGIDIIAVSCGKCGHIELFDAAVVSKAADEIDKDFREKGWR